MRQKDVKIIAIAFIVGFLLTAVILQRFEITKLQNKENAEVDVEIALEHCPLCDGNANVKPVNDSFYIKCDDCELYTDYFDSKTELIKYWNNRAE